MAHLSILVSTSLMLFSTSMVEAVTCTPLSRPAIVLQRETFSPAINNGIDDVSYSMVRFQWTSDATRNPVNYQRIVYATAAQWAANGNRIIAGTAGVNYSVHFAGNAVVRKDDSIQGSTIGNLEANTTYHIAGQSSTDQGVTFCAAVEEVFTTLPFTGFPKPESPKTFDLIPPHVTGTDYTVGIAPCPDLQTCLNLARPGDGIGINPKTPVSIASYVTLPVPPSAIAIHDIRSSVFSATAHGLKDGALVHIGSNYYPPSPINPGVTYSVINAHPNDFQLSQDGITPLTLNDKGVGNIYVIRWPIRQNYVLIHSTASPAQLPPSGVRLDPKAYDDALGVIRLSGPYSGEGSLLKVTQLSSFYWFNNIKFETAPNAPANEIDPTPYTTLVSTDAQADHIIFYQCYFHPAAAPDRIINAVRWGGTNQAIINSYIDNVDYWTPTRIGKPAISIGNTITVPPMTFSWPTQGNVRNTCALSDPATLSFSGAGSHTFFLYWTINPCVLTIKVQNGAIVTGSAFHVTSSDTPTYPTSARGNSTVLKIGEGSFNGSVATVSDAGITGGSKYVSESATGIGFGLGPGPYIFSNNYFAGQGIIGLYRDEWTANGCLGVTRCPLLYNALDLIVTRNTVTWDQSYVSSSPSWNGSWWWGRNAFELKQGTRVKYDGNIVGPTYGGISNAECLDLFVYWGDNPENWVNTGTTGDIEFVNNSCLETGSMISMGPVSRGTTPGRIMQRIWLHNNIFVKNNGYTQNPLPNASIPAGRGFGITQGESLILEHNTVWGQGGRGLGSLVLYSHLSGGISATYNIFNYATDPPGDKGLVFSTHGPTFGEAPAPNSVQGTALLTYLNNTVWSNNIMLATCSDSHAASPYCAEELKRSEITSAKQLYPPPPLTFWPTNGSSLAERIAAVPGLSRLFAHLDSNYARNRQFETSTVSDLAGAGTDFGALEAAQGKVNSVHVEKLSSATATIAFVAPDEQGCSVDYGSADFTKGLRRWTRILNPGGHRDQAVSLTGLSSNTTYTYRINCSVMQPTGTLTTTN